MKQRVILDLTLAAMVSAITIPTFPAWAQVPTRTSIEELQQRSRGTTISGKVVNIVGNNFVLDDGTGQIIVDAGPRWWREINLEPGEQVTVSGEVSKKSGNFDASSITRSNGSAIEIRPAEGPPPWAGGPNRAPKPPKR